MTRASPEPAPRSPSLADVEVLSLAWRTDLALLAQSGSEVEHHPAYVVVRTPGNPTFRWGNFVLLRRSPLLRDLPGLADRVEALLPGLGHHAVGIDDPAAGREDVERLRRPGWRGAVDAVLTADAVLPPRHEQRSAVVRALTGDADWAQKAALDLACADGAGPEHEVFATRRAAAERAAVETGHGAWFGAFDGERLLAGLGIFRAGDGLARFQTVQTHPEARRRGLAQALLHHAGAHALGELGARRLVLVADPDHHALDLYLGAGFARTESQVSAEGLRTPARP